MDSRFTNLLIIVPTRNRADLAINAICSVLEQDGSHVQVLVSDNSTQVEESRKLAEFCRGLPGDRLSYIQPPEPLPMSRHWNWAIEQALQRSTASHFVYLTDRMIFRPGELHRLVEILEAFPDRVVSYNHDRIVDHVRPIRVQQFPWTGQLFEIASQELLSLASRSVIYHPALPKMLNCAVPRAVLITVRERFGNIFDSVSPDFNFCFRCLDVVDGVILYDRSALIHYALDRSNGMGFVRGIPTPDHKDFLTTLGTTTSLHFSTPIPEVQTVGNAIFHEYCTVKQETGSSRFPEVEIESYIEYLAREVDQLENVELQERMWVLLSQHGWRKPVLGPRLSRVASRVVELRSPRKVARKLLWLSTSSMLGNVWLLLARRFGIPLPAHNHIGFKSREAALEIAIRFPPQKSPQPNHLPGRFRILQPPPPVHSSAITADEQLVRDGSTASFVIQHLGSNGVMRCSVLAEVPIRKGSDGGV